MPSEAPAPVSRRSLLKGIFAGTAAAAAVRVFDPAPAYAAAGAGVFGFGVASGDPTLDSVIIWTRATPSNGAAPGSDGGSSGYDVLWEVAADRAFANVVESAVVSTSRDGVPARHIPGDYTVKIDVTGLSPYTRYYYRFTALAADGSSVEVSPVGRTQTMPDHGDVRALRFALVTCSNYTGGYFSAYRVIGQRSDLDFVMHVGDYIYEYGNGADRYGPASTAFTSPRVSSPAGDLIMLQDYRLRHGVHKADPDCALAHQQTPWITIFDDHEVANNTWNAGAENHYTTGSNTARGIPAEGDFLTRRAAAYQAYLEWMPFRYPVQPAQQTAHQGQQFFRKFTWGQLADISMLETRQNRSGQINSDGTTGYDNYPTTGNGGGGFVVKSTVTSVDAANPGRHMPEPEQVTWLTNTVNTVGRPWHLIGNQVMFVPVNYLQAVLVKGGSTAVTYVNSDQWDGYPANQAQLISALGSAAPGAGDSVLFTGDIHSSWACDIPLNQGTYAAATPGNSAGVEFVTPSVTSDGFYEAARASYPTPETAVTAVRTMITAGIETASPWVRYFDGVGHGFTVIDVTPARVQCDYYLTPDPTTAQPEPRAVQSVVPAYATSYQTLAGSRKVSTATGPVGARSDTPADASQPVSALPEHVGPAAVAGVLAAGAFVAYSRRRNGLAASDSGLVAAQPSD